MKQIASLLISIILLNASVNAQEIDYRKIAEASAWVWDDRGASPFSFPQQFIGKLDYEMVFRIKPGESKTRESTSIEFWKKGVMRTKVPLSVFTIHEDFLTYVFDEEGGTVVQVDLSTGEERWRSILKGVPVVLGSVGRKDFNLKTPNNSVVEVRIKQDECRYIAFLRSETGELLGFKAFGNSTNTDFDQAQAPTGMGSSIGGDSLANDLDLKKTLAETNWNWSETDANPLFSMINGVDSKEYKISIENGEHGNIIFIVRKVGSDNSIFSWIGHQWTVFRISENSLVFADWNPCQSGGEIVSVDLATGLEIWRTSLDGLGPNNNPDTLENMEYFNRLNICINSKYISICGNESLGRYVEFKDRSTGETLFRKLFPNERLSPSSPADSRTRR